MAPIRVGLIGLASKVTPYYTIGEWGNQHLKVLTESPLFELVAVCNSTKESAEKSIAFHGLPSTVKAYGSVADLASDPNVELVSVVVNINKHYDIMKTVIEHKKNIYVEFPVTPGIAESKELDALAKAAGVDVVVGAQARGDFATRKLKSIIESGDIGDVVFTSFNAQMPLSVAQGWPQAAQGFLDIESDISRYNIVIAHQIDSFLGVHGDFKKSQATFKVAENPVKILDGQGSVVDPAYKATAPDTVAIQGVLANGAVASFNIHSAPVSAEGRGYRWAVAGSKGEVTLTAGEGFFQMGFVEPKVSLVKFGGEVEQIDMTTGEGEYYAKVGPMALNIMRVYEAYAKGDKNGYSTLEQTVAVQKTKKQIKDTAIWA